MVTLDKSAFPGRYSSFTLQKNLEKPSVASVASQSFELTIEINCCFIFSSVTDILSN